MSLNGASTVPNLLTMPMFPNMPDILQLQLQAFANAKNNKTVEKRSPRPENGISIPYSVLVGLALTNANGEPISTTAIYDFIEAYFPNSPNRSSNTWKSSIRNALCKYDFVGKTAHYAYAGVKDHYDWIIVKENAPKFERLLKRFEGNHPDISSYGLRDVADWPLLKAGTKGLPEWKARRINLKSVPSYSKEHSPSPIPPSPVQLDLKPVSSSCPSSENPSPSPPVPSFSVENLTATSIPPPQSLPAPPSPMCLWNPMAMPFMLPYMMPPSYLEVYVASLKQHIDKLQEMQTTKLKS